MGIALGWEESGDPGQTLISEVVGTNNFTSLDPRVEWRGGEGEQTNIELPLPELGTVLQVTGPSSFNVYNHPKAGIDPRFRDEKPRLPASSCSGSARRAPLRWRKCGCMSLMVSQAPTFPRFITHPDPSFPLPISLESREVTSSPGSFLAEWLPLVLFPSVQQRQGVGGRLMENQLFCC